MRDLVADCVARDGLEFFGIVALQPEPEYKNFQQWLMQGKHADMSYLAKNQIFRHDPSQLEIGTSRAIIVGLSYNCGDKLLSSVNPYIAQYARFRDYHKILRQKGTKILESLSNSYKEIKQPINRVAVDSAPILERALAARTLSGFIGKNTMFIHPRKGSLFCLAALLTSLPLPIDDQRKIDHTKRTSDGGCGSCRRCQVNCPTGALDKSYSLDARKCLSYWTIEHRGTIPFEFWPHLKKYYFGCDLCQLSCPYNRYSSLALTTRSSEYNRYQLRELSLSQIATMDEATYIKYCGGTPLTRAKRSGLQRNALIAMVVSKDPLLDSVIKKLTKWHNLPEVLQKTIAQIDLFQNDPQNYS